MKKLFIFALFLFTVSINSQNSFEGIINYSVEIETAKDSVALKQKLENFNGNDISMHYWKDGHFKINYKSISATYLPTSGKLILYKKENIKANSPIGKLHFLSKRKVESIIVLDKRCDCYQYNTEDINGVEEKITYCFSEETPKIDYKLFKTCKDFFLKEYYETAERPYLKYIEENKYQKVSWTAKSIEIKQLEPISTQ
jgi:hypothetical protein